jgi:hypothetical protein
LPPEEQHNCDAELKKRCDDLVEKLRKIENETDLIVIGK